jgi:sugar O-acyltransferase (sialic acid O-acetyltransferase NeuD family)
MKKLYLIGGGGHCRSCIDVIEETKEYTIAGIFDVASEVGKNVLGYPVIDIDENIPKYMSDGNFFLITVGQIKSPDLRIKLFELNLNFATVISPRAYVSKHAKVGAGTIIMHDSLVNTGVCIGNNCIINSKALIEHDSVIGNHCHISTGAIINGDCVIGDRTFIGSNSTIKNGKKIEAGSLISYGVKA